MYRDKKDMTAGMPKYKNDKQMKDRSEEYNRARRDVAFEQERKAVDREKNAALETMLAVQMQKEDLLKLEGNIKAAIATLNATQSASSIVPPNPEVPPLPTSMGSNPSGMPPGMPNELPPNASPEQGVTPNQLPPM